MPHACQDVGGGILEADDGNGANIPGSVEDAGAISRVQSRGRGRVADDALSELACHSPGGGRGDPPPPHQRGSDLPGVLPQNDVVAPVPGSRVPVWGIKPVQPPGSLCAPPCVGHNCDPVGG